MGFVIFFIPTIINDDLKLDMNPIEDIILNSKLKSIGNVINEEYLFLFPQLSKNKFITNLYEMKTLSILIMFYFSSFLGVTAYCAGIITIICFASESSLNNSQLHYNYRSIMLGYIISHPFYYIFSSIINNYCYSYLVILLLSIASFCMLLKIKESPRYLYEYADYYSLTNFVMNHADIKVFDTLLIEEKSIMNYEFNLNKNISFYPLLSAESLLVLDARKNLKYSRFNIFKYLFNSKKLTDNLPVLFSLTMIVSCFYSFVLSCYAKEDFQKVYKISKGENNRFYFLKSYRMIFDISKIFSIFFFAFINRFFGVTLVLKISFSLGLVASLIFGLLDFNIKEIDDFDENHLEKILVQDKNFTALIWLLSILVFVSTGALYSLYFYLLRFTKTLYRCTAIGVFFCVFQLGGYISVVLYTKLNINLIYVSIVNFIGLVLCVFMEDDVEETMIKDHRKIKLS